MITLNLSSFSIFIYIRYMFKSHSFRVMTDALHGYKSISTYKYTILKIQTLVNISYDFTCQVFNFRWKHLFIKVGHDTMTQFFLCRCYCKLNDSCILPLYFTFKYTHILWRIGGATVFNLYQVDTQRPLICQDSWWPKINMYRHKIKSL